VTKEAMGNHSIPKGQPRRRTGPAWRRCEQMEYKGQITQPCYCKTSYYYYNINNV